MTLDEALTAIARRLDAIPDLTVTTDPGAVVNPPMALVNDGTVEYHATMNDNYAELTVVVTVYVSKADSAEGALEIRQYKSPSGAKSISQAIETAVSGDELEAGRNRTLRAISGETSVIGRGESSEGWLALTVTCQMTLAPTPA